MYGFTNRRRKHGRETIARNLSWKLGVKFFDVRHASSYDENVGIKGVDHDRKTAGYSVQISLPDERSQMIPGVHLGDDVFG